ncbi:DUF6232 family protein [Sphingopyxis sp.]|uniref:DUF6232 family protein n=1 Tax=Sphingopyxis sp. TaxID=1908224 RepID=UPI003D6D98E9
MDEKIFYQSGVVRVTNARFVVDNQTHAMNGVTSIAHVENQPQRTGLIIALILGVLLLFAGSGGMQIFGFLVAAVCGFLLYQQKTTHIVVLRSSSGEVKALSDTDETHIRRVVEALNDALIHRG